jgi:hypothetical protein
MRSIAFLAVAATAALYSGIVRSQALFDLEHARGNYRAGLVSEFDADLIRTWGAPSGRYPAADVRHATPRHHHGNKKKVRASKAGKTMKRAAGVRSDP